MTMNDHARENEIEYVTVLIGKQLFGLPIERVHDVFMPGNLTPVPLSSPEIAGVLNLRGRIVTAIDMRRRLGLPEREEKDEPMAVGIDCDGESYGLIIDSVGEVLRLGEQTREPVPVNIDERLARVASCVHRLEQELLVVLDIGRLLDLRPSAKAA